MSYSIIDALLKYKFTVLFYFLVFLFVFINRKKFDFHGKLIALYRTKIGINFMNYTSTKARKFLKYMGYGGIFVGFAGMIVTFILILNLTYRLIFNEPGAGGVSPVIPGLPIAGTGIDFPLITGWIAIFIIIIVHEFSHGVVASVHNIKVKHSGIAFFGPILGAFVEPDERKLTKEKDSVQYSVFAAGSFANLLSIIVINIIVVLIFAPIVNSLVFSEGVVISPQPGLPADKAGITNSTIITRVNGVNISTISDFQKIIKDVGVNETINLSSANQTFVITTTQHPEKPLQGYLGIWIHGSKTQLKNENIFTKIMFNIIIWLLSLLGWVAFLSLNIGLINLLPIFITDGARMLKVAVERLIQNRKQSMSIWLNVNWVCVFLILILLFLPFLRWLNANLSSILINFFV